MSTKYKDELIRVAHLMGLPDDTDPTAVADALAERIAVYDAATGRATALETECDNLSRTVAAQSAKLSVARERLEPIAAQLIERRSRPTANAQTFADFTAGADQIRNVIAELG